jgi:hypothetical protein
MMKELLLKYKAGLITITAVFLLLLVITVIRYVKAMNAVQAAIGEKLMVIPDEEIHDAGWNIPEIKEKKKEINWLERQLLLAKSDSLNLGISLNDSIVQVQLKGTVLVQAKMIKQHPLHFFDSLNYGAYHDFTRIAAIVEEQSTIPKKPIRKVQAPKNENEVQEFKHDTIPDPPLVWQFSLNNRINVVITGVGLDKDSVLNFQYNKNLIDYNYNYLKNNLLPETYIPTLYIWLMDKDAKSIYRAIPEKGKVVFKN